MQTKLSVFCNKIIEAGWLVVVVAVPLFFNIYTARTFEPDKITLLRSVVTIMIVAWIISVVEQGFGGADNNIPLFQRLRRWLRIPLLLPTLLLVLFYIVSTIFSLSPKVSIWGSYQRMEGTYSFLSYVVIFALMAGNLRTREQVDRLVTTIIVASVPVGLYGVIQHYGLDPLPWAGDVTSRVASNMGNAIFVASYMIMIVPLTLSRLIESMTAIIKEDKASWGHTILAAIYIFVLAVQIILIMFTQSRGPMLGLLGAGFVMGLLILLILRRINPNPDRLAVKEILFGLSFLLLLGVAGLIGGAAGFIIGFGLDTIVAIDSLPLLAAAIGGILGFLGLYTYMAAAQKGWRWIWLSWFAVGVLTVIFVVTLNIRGTPLDTYLDPIRGIPYVSRLANVIETEGTGKVRVLIWDAATKLILPHQPLGIAGDDVTGQDRFNWLRPLVGYGPESMFNAFAYVYPPDLAHVEARGSSADRSHNETMDTLVITGILGFLAFYFLMISLFYYALRWLGWAPDPSSRRRLIILLILFGLLGAVIPYLVDTVDDRYTFIALGLPIGLIVGVVVHLVWQGVVRQRDDDERVVFSNHPLLLIALLGAIIGHFIEVHFVFSIAATYTYFWVYAGLMVALARMNQIAHQTTATPVKAAEFAAEAAERTTVEVDPEESASRRSRRTRRRSANRQPVAPADSQPPSLKQEGLDTWVGSLGLAMAIVLMIITFDFITPAFQFVLSDTDSMSLLWMFAITWLIGLVIVLSDLAVRRALWGNAVSWGRVILLYGVTSLGYFLIYYLAHRVQFGQKITVSGIADVIRAADVLVGGLRLFYIFLFLLMVLLAIMLSWQSMKRLNFWRSDNWWLYPPLVIAALALIWFKNLDVVRADIYLKEGDRYRNGSQWNQAIALHDKARTMDSDEDFYYLMLALDYQLMAQDGNLPPETRAGAWQQGEDIAMEARRINPYNPDNTGNMGRYYFTVGQVFDPDRFTDALEYFEKATILAPSNVIYHNLWAQTYYILQNYQSAIERLEQSVEIDPRYPPTWILLGDTYAAMGDVDKALEAHTQAMSLLVREDGVELFADQFLDQRLNFYVSAGKLEDIVAAMQQVAQDRQNGIDDLAAPVETRERARSSYAKLQCAIGRTYNLAGQPDKAVAYLQQCRINENNSERSIRELANTYLSQGSFDQALPLYQALMQTNPNDVEAHSALAYIYAQQGRLEEAVLENQRVLEQSPANYDSLKNIAVLYQQMQRWQDALDYARQAQAVAPESDAQNWITFIQNIEQQLNSQ
jgi:tetratricopeptide (TPR) repeat protein